MKDSGPPTMIQILDLFAILIIGNNFQQAYPTHNRLTVDDFYAKKRIQVKS